MGFRRHDFCSKLCNEVLLSNHNASLFLSFLVPTPSKAKKLISSERVFESH